MRLSLLVFSCQALPLLAGNCGDLVRAALPDTTITLSREVAAGAGAVKNLPAYCEVQGVLKPTAASKIGFAVWLPVAGWNGRLEGVGNGGLAGTISYAAMGTALRAGYAAASTDTGHAASEPLTWLQDRERLIDYSYRGLHLTTVAAKSLIAAYYGRGAAYSYYSGCSTGGKQGLMEAQRFPADYDGIVAGDAANFWTHQMADHVWNGIVTSSPETNLTADKLQLVQDAVMAQCDKLDGLADGLIGDTAACHFDPAKLRCKGAETAGCLTEAQAGAVAKLYSGPVSPSTGKKLYEGLYPGGEVGWGKAGGQMVINRGTTSGVSSYDFLRYALFDNPGWDFRSFDFDRDLAAADQKLGPVSNAIDPDLSEFRRMGHKLVYYHGTNDPIIPAQNGIDYFQSVARLQGGEDAAREFYRVFLVPGLYHCSGGPGATAFGGSAPAPAGQMDADHDVVSAAARWVEKGVAPDRIVASKYQDNDPAKPVVLQRPLCPWPQVARYKGSGDPADAANFRCMK